MLSGYARVSTADQNLDLQQDVLEKAGCSKIFTDVASGAVSDRRGLQDALEYVRQGDVLVVWRLDRLGRSLQHLLEVINDLQVRGVGFRSLSESLDTTTSGGKLVFQIFGALAEFERNLIRERTQAGLKAARARGRLGGRPKILDPSKAALIKKLYSKKNTPSTNFAVLLESLNPVSIVISMRKVDQLNLLKSTVFFLTLTRHPTQLSS